VRLHQQQQAASSNACNRAGWPAAAREQGPLALPALRCSAGSWTMVRSGLEGRNAFRMIVL
jgi:hypothetical protein